MDRLPHVTKLIIDHVTRELCMDGFYSHWERITLNNPGIGWLKDEIPRRIILGHGDEGFAHRFIISTLAKVYRCFEIAAEGKPLIPIQEETARRVIDDLYPYGGNIRLHLRMRELHGKHPSIIDHFYGSYKRIDSDYAPIPKCRILAGLGMILTLEEQIRSPLALA